MRPALAAIALFALVLPEAGAQGGATSSLEISGLAAETVEERSVALLPFNVTYALDGLVCVGGALTVTVDLSARTREGNATSRVSPPQMFFTIDQLDSAQGGYEATQAGLLVVEADAGEPSWANVSVGADVTYFSGCGVLNVPGDEASGTASVRFAPATDPPQAVAPAGPWAAGLALLLVAASRLKRAGGPP